LLYEEVTCGRRKCRRRRTRTRKRRRRRRMRDLPKCYQVD
jgi:hypothetical protein